MNYDLDAIRQNLIDAGCKDKFIEEFIKELKEDEKEKAFNLLCKKRKDLLDSIHLQEHQIYCLDYLINQFDHDY